MFGSSSATIGKTDTVQANSFFSIKSKNNINEIKNILNSLGSEKRYLLINDILDVMDTIEMKMSDFERICEALIDSGIKIFDTKKEAEDYNDEDKEEDNESYYQPYFDKVLLIEPSLENFINELKEIPILSRRDLNILIKLAGTGNEAAKKNLTIYYSKKVVRMALYFYENIKTQMQISDLIQDGMIGLMKAIDKLKTESFGYHISAYSGWWINQRMHRANADFGIIRLPVHVFEIYKKMYNYIQENDMDFEDIKDINEASNNFDISDETLFNIMRIFPDVLSIELLLEHEKDYDLGIYNIDNDEDINFINSDDTKKIIQEILETLKPKEAQILKYRYGLFDGKEYTLERIGSIYGVTRERIRQICEKALRRLRHPSRSKKLRDLI